MIGAAVQHGLEFVEVYIWCISMTWIYLVIPCNNIYIISQSFWLYYKIIMLGYLEAFDDDLKQMMTTEDAS